MKELTYKIRQIFMSTRVIENDHKYKGLSVSCSIIHAIFMVLFYMGGVIPLAAFNLFSTIFYLLGGYYLTANKKYREMFIVAFVEIELNSSMCSFLLGDGYEFMIYTLSLIPGAFYLAHTWPTDSKKRFGISIIPMISTFIIGAMYLIVEFVYSVISPYYASIEILRLRPIFHYFNILVAVLLLLIFSILFALEVRYIQKLLNDENSRLGEIASRDPLTKAYNRRSIMDIVNQEIEGEIQEKFGLILLDIDDFKKINDTYGHSVGDQVLIQIASIMQENIREDDYLCRWGGEEFLIVVHGDEDDYGTVAERIRSSIETYVFDNEGNSFSVTATLGISKHQTGLKLRTLVDMADQKMYYGKNHGKNQVVE